MAMIHIMDLFEYGDTDSHSVQIMTSVCLATPFNQAHICVCFQIRIPSLDQLVTDAANDVAWMSKLLTRHQSLNSNPDTKYFGRNECLDREKTAIPIWGSNNKSQDAELPRLTSTSSNLETVQILES